jgi:hypothetical protein
MLETTQQEQINAPSSRLIPNCPVLLQTQIATPCLSSSRLQDATSFDGGDVDPAGSHLHLRIRRRKFDIEVDQEDPDSREGANLMDDI